ncbi:hypothetical protein PT274_03435 [Leuconostocaceae bacterium ESL0958]|nr:hypothetical protein [Leuconostocaceae bacterium ESL0958]
MKSKFYADLSKYEPKTNGGTFTKKQARLLWQLVPISLAMIASWIFVTSWIGPALAIMIGLFLMVPLLLKWADRWDNLKHSYDFFFVIKDRTFRSKNSRR